MGASPECDGTDADRHVKDTPAGCHSEGVLVWFRYPGMDCGASSGTGGADRGDGFPLWNGEGGRKCEGNVHPVVVTKPEDCERTAGFDCY